MKFAPLEFVTNTFAGPSGGDLEASQTPTNGTAAAATTRRSSRRSPRTRISNSIDNNNSDDDNDDDSLAASPSKNVRFDVPSSDDSEPEQELTNNSSQFFVLRKEIKSSARSSEQNKDVVSPPKTTGVGDSSLSNPNKTKTPSPGRTLAKKISPTSNASLTTPINSNTNAITPSGKKPRKQSSKENRNEIESTPDPESTGAVVSQQKKKRLSVYEQLTHDANAFADQWKEDSDEGLRFKRKIHKEKLKEIRETEDQMQQLKQKLDKLKSVAGELETLIRKDLENKKRAIKVGNALRKTASRATKRALKEKDDFKINLKAKDTLLKEAKKECKKELQNQKRARADSDSDDDLEVSHSKSKKKRKVFPTTKQKSENSDENESDASDSDDSDWEGASKRKAKNAKKRVDQEEEFTDGSSPRRQTRVRSSKWNCQRCTLENEMQDHECIACGSTRPGYIPEF